MAKEMTNVEVVTSRTYKIRSLEEFFRFVRALHAHTGVAAISTLTESTVNVMGTDEEFENFERRFYDDEYDYVDDDGIYHYR